MKSSLFLIVTLLTGFITVSCSTSSSKKQPNLPVTTASSPTEYQELLNKYVTPAGVHYDQWAQNSGDLDKLKNVTYFYATNAAPKEQTKALAWYLNAYNAWTIQKIFDHWPNEGPLDASLLFFHKKSIRVAGRRMSFLHLENEIIRKQFNEPRIHFALNCASRSCPPLHDQAFKANTLGSTLEKLTKDFINNNTYALVEKSDEVAISKIFEWYHEDFGGKENLLNYTNKYRSKKISTEKKVTFQEYNWQLNRHK